MSRTSIVEIDCAR